MALDPFSGVQTARQIVATAEGLANYPGKNLTANGNEGSDSSPTPGDAPFTALAYVILQNHLDHLALTQNFTFTRTALDIDITARNNNLPTINNGASIGYWRVGFSDPAYIVSNDNTQRSPFYMLDVKQFHDRFQDGIIGTPQFGYINRAEGTITVDPAPDQVYTLELHFYPWQPGLADVDARPWFPYSEYLVQALLYYLYYQDDDSRRQDAKQNMMEMMKQIKGGTGDERDRPGRLDLDPTVHNPVWGWGFN